MNILLVQPPVRDFYQTYIRTQPLGLAYLASTAIGHGHEVDILDLNLTGGAREIEFDKYNVIGISLDTSRYNSAIKIAKQAMAGDNIVVIGGPHASFTADNLLNNGFAHYVVRGEGEESFTELLGCGVNASYC